MSGVRNLATEEIPEPNTDYLITLIGSLKGKYTPETFDDSEQNEISYYLQIERIEKLIDLKTNKEVVLEEKKPLTYSQKWRWIVQKEVGDYDNFMNWMIANQNKIFEIYKESI